MASAQVTLQEVSLDNRVPSFRGVYSGIAIDAPKGDLIPVLVTSETALLKRYTPDETLKTGYDQAFYSALAYLAAGNKLWVSRVSRENAAWAGATVNKLLDNAGGGPVPNAAWVSGETSDPETDYVFGAGERMVAYAASPGAWGSDTYVRILEKLDDQSVILNATLGTEGYVHTDDASVGNYVQFDIDARLYTGMKVRVKVGTGESLPIGLSNQSVYYIRVSESESGDTGHPFKKVQFYNSYKGASGDLDGDETAQELAFLNPVDLSATGTGTLTVKQILAHENDDTYLLGIYSAKAESALIRYIEFSLDPDGVNSSNNNVFADTVSQASTHVRLKVNVAETGDIEPQYTFLKLAGGADGDAATTADRTIAIEKLSDKDNYPMLMVLDGGHAVNSYHRAILAMCEARQDCVGIFSTPFANEESDNYLNELVDYRRVTLNANTSFGALFTPHVKIEDKYTKKTLQVPPDGYFAGALNRTFFQAEVWYPVSGWRRGQINVLDVHRKIDKGERDYLADNSLNPIRFAAGRGIVFWGQKTLLAADNSLSRLNVRFLGIVVGQAIVQAMEDFVYELNDEITRDQAVTLIITYLDGVRSRRGILGFRVQSDKDNNTESDIAARRMNVDVFIKPIEGVEEIPVRLVYTPYGLDFSTASEQV